MRLFTLVVLFLQIGFAKAQSAKLPLNHNSALIFFDEKMQRFVVIDDSTYFSSYNPASKQWERHPLSAKFGCSFSEFALNYVPLPRPNRSTLLVHVSGGIVFEFQKGALNRIDKSFAHMNQFGGTHFIRNNEPHIACGYGLFTFKNFISRFDLTSKEWFKLIITGPKPKPRKRAISLLEDNYLYLFGGEGEQDEIRCTIRDCWRFDFKSNKWKCLGKLNSLVPSVTRWQTKTEVSCSGIYPNYLISAERIFEFFPTQNKFRMFVVQDVDKYLSISVGGHLLMVKEYNHSTGRVNVVIYNKKSFFQDLVHEDHFIYKSESKSNNQLFIFISCIIMVLMISFALLRKRIFKNSLSFATNEGLVLTEAERDLLSLFSAHQEKGIEIHQINDLLNFGDPSIDTLKKRREQLLKEFKYKLSKHFNIELNEVFLEERMSTDKRMKIMFLNPLIFERLKQNKPPFLK